MARKGTRNTTLKDIALEAGVSITAVSKVLNNMGGTSKETEKKIKDIARRLNYIPNKVAQSLRTNETHTIGIVVADSSEAFFAKVIKGIQDTAARQGYDVLLCNTDGDYEKEKGAIYTLLNKRISGLALASSKLTSVKDYEFLKNLGVPFVFFIRRSEEKQADYVANDNALGAYMMTNHLLKTRKDKVYFINLNQDSPSAIDRLKGYKKSLEENGVEYDPNIIYNCNPTVEDGYIVMRQLLDKGEDIKTVFCGCDVIAIGAMEAIYEKHLKIPGDIRVGAYDDIDFSAYLRTPLTTVRQPRYLIGCKGTDLLIGKIENKINEVNHIILKPELVIRQST